MARKVEVAIIGAGTAGLTARRQVAEATDSYVVIDDGILGTTCARVGCMPSKVLIQVANDFHRRRVFDEMGIHGAESLTIDLPQAMQHVRKLRDRFVRSVMASIEPWKDRHLIAKRARFVDGHTLDLGDERIVADRIILATGSRPIIPGPWQEFKHRFIDTNSFFELDELPKRIAVVGLGVIGIELGQALHRLGVNVVGIGKGKSIGGLSDPQMVEYVSRKFSEEMELDFSGVKSMREEEGDLVLATENLEYRVDKVLVAVGRRPNLDQLDLENIGAEIRSNGVPDYNPNTFQIRGTDIFIAGDVNAERPILHESADEGAVAGLNASVDKVQAFRRRTFLGITFSSPNIAVVGKSYAQLQNEKVEFLEGEASFEGQGRAIVMLSEKGHLKVYGSKTSNKILGAELFAPGGEHLAHLLAWVISQEMTVQEVLSLPFYHPVLEEGLRTALRHLASNLGETRSQVDLATCVEHPTSNCK